MMETTIETKEEMNQLFKNLYQEEVRREESIHHSASSLLIAEGCVFGFTLVADVLLFLVRQGSMLDEVGCIVCSGSLFAAVLMAALAQWHPARDAITNSEDIQVQLEEAPESFHTHEQRVQYELDLYEKISADLQHTNSMLNNRLRASSITFVSGTGLWIIVISLMLFGI
jgi:hypothetical protein